jgi:hypothetical protein
MFKYNPEFHLAFGKVEPREMDVRLRVQSRQLGNTRVGREGKLLGPFWSLVNKMERLLLI